MSSRKVLFRGLKLSAVVVVAVVLVLSTTANAFARHDEFGGDAFALPYAPYTAGPVVSEVEPYAPYVAGPVIHPSDLAH